MFLLFACVLNAASAGVNIGLFYDHPLNPCLGIVNGVIAVACYLGWLND